MDGGWGRMKLPCHERPRSRPLLRCRPTASVDWNGQVKVVENAVGASRGVPEHQIVDADISVDEPSFLIDPAIALEDIFEDPVNLIVIQATFLSELLDRIESLLYSDPKLS